MLSFAIFIASIGLNVTLRRRDHRRNAQLPTDADAPVTLLNISAKKGLTRTDRKRIEACIEACMEACMEG